MGDVDRASEPVRATLGRTPFYRQIPAGLFEEIRTRVLANAVRPKDRTKQLQS